MRRLSIVCTAGLLAFCLSSPTIAAQKTGDQKNREIQNGQAIEEIGASEAASVLGGDLIGENGDKLGVVQHIIFSQEDRDDVKYLMVKDEQDRLHPVPIELIQIDEEQRQATAQIDRHTFANSPVVDITELTQLRQQQMMEDIEQHYGISPAWRKEQKRSSPSRQSPDGSRQTDEGQMNGDQQIREERRQDQQVIKNN